MNVKEIINKIKPYAEKLIKKYWKYALCYICGVLTVIFGILLFSNRNRPSSDSVRNGISDTKESVESISDGIEQLKGTSESIEHTAADITDTISGLTETSERLDNTEKQLRESSDRFGEILQEIRKRKIEN